MANIKRLLGVETTRTSFSYGDEVVFMEVEERKREHITEIIFGKVLDANYDFENIRIQSRDGSKWIVPKEYTKRIKDLIPKY